MPDHRSSPIPALTRACLSSFFFPSLRASHPSLQNVSNPQTQCTPLWSLFPEPVAGEPFPRCQTRSGTGLCVFAPNPGPPACFPQAPATNLARTFFQQLQARPIADQILVAISIQRRHPAPFRASPPRYGGLNGQNAFRALISANRSEVLSASGEKCSPRPASLSRICAGWFSNPSCGRRTSAGVVSEALAATTSHPSSTMCRSGGGAWEKVEGTPLSSCRGGSPRSLPTPHPSPTRSVPFPHLPCRQTLLPLSPTPAICGNLPVLPDRHTHSVYITLRLISGVPFQTSERIQTGEP